MKKYSLLIVFCLCCIYHGQSQNNKDIDPIAVKLLDHMANLIGELESCSFTMSRTIDYIDPDYGFIKHYSTSEVFLDGPDKLMVQTKGTKGDKGFWYNGQELDFYSYNENNYVTIPTPNSTLKMIDSIHDNYGILFPAADFFYPSLTDDIIEGFDSIKFIGKNNINNTECFLIKASNQEMDVLIWIANDAYKLPKRHVIRYKNKDNRQYEATFKSWSINPNIPKTMFEFVPPQSASKIEIKPKK